jgi:hypothetical protein
VNRLYIFTAITIGYASFLQAQYTAIPGPIFEEFLISQGFDDIIDGQVLTDNIDDIDFLQINEILYTFPIEDFTGIQDFASLELLQIESSNCTSIDFGNLTNLLHIGISFSEELEEIDVSGCVNLEELFLYNSILNTLDVLQNINLTKLAVVYSYGNLNTIDVSFNTNLTTFGVAETNLNEIDLRNGTNENIEFFNSQNNPNLRCVFVDDATFSAANWINIEPTTTFVETEEECEALSLEDISTIEFNIFPNPVKDKLFISTSFDLLSYKANIFNINGKQVLSLNDSKLNNNSIDLQELTSGIYFVQINDNQGRSAIKKFIKN